MAKDNPVQSAIIKATGLVVLMNLISRVLGFVRDAVIAREFGAGEATDAYFVAYTLPYALQAVLGMAFLVVIVPVITSYLTDNNRSEAWNAGSIIFNWTFLILFVVTIVGFILAPQLVSILAPGFTPGQQELAAELTRIIFPSIVFMGLGMLLTGLLNAGGIFGVPAFAPGLTNIVIILAVIFLSAQYKVEGLAYGTLAGFIAFFLIQLPSLKKLGFKYFLNFEKSHSALKQVSRNIFPILLAISVNQAYLAINRIFASGLADGSITALDFSYRLMAVPLGIFAFAVATTFYPEFSRRISRGDHKGLSDTLLQSLNMIILVSIPAAVGLMVLRYPLVRFIFERGAFDSTATAMTADALLCFSIGLLGIGAYLIIIRAFFAKDNYRTPLSAGIICVVVNVILSFILINYLEHKGLALANSLAVTVSVIYMLGAFKLQLPDFQLRKLLGPLVKTAASAIIMGGAIIILQPYLLVLGDSFIGLAAQLTVMVLFGISIFYICASLLKVKELQDITKLIGKKASNRF